MKRYAAFLGFVGLLGFLVPSADAQTNPCASSLTVMATNPTIIYVEHAQLAQVFPDGSPVVVSVTIAAFAKGADLATATPVTFVTVPRSAFTPVSGFATCYQATLAQPLAVPVAVEQLVAARASNAMGNSPWTGGNPFYAAGAPSGFSNVRAR